MKKLLCLLLGLTLMIMAAGCKKKSTDPETIYYYASVQIKGVGNTFKTTSTFSKLCLMTGVCNTFYTDPTVQDKNYLMIGFPTSVKAGVTYTSDSSHTQILYVDNAGRRYFSTWGDSLNITVTKWEGHGGTGTGTFSGKLRYEIVPPNPADSIYIKNGTFSAKIWFVTGN
ncbi:MAG: hypothetical protein NT004_01550 [Bacteroidetes bacterium]|nr:hypothetical protein [Bacteroidota bacterium]